MNIKFNIRSAKIQDIPRMLELIQELAEYEKAPNEVTNTIEAMERDGFSVDKVFDSFVAEVDNKIIGLAITYFRYSTWKGKCLYLEDLIVNESFRGNGVGQQLFNHCIDFGKMNNCVRMNWQVLDWNTPAINFYNKYNAHLDEEWINGSLEL